MVYNARMLHRQTEHPEIDDASWRSMSQRIAQVKRRTMYTVGMLNRVAARVISGGSEDYIAYQTPARIGKRTYLDGSKGATTMGLVTTYRCKKCHKTRRGAGLFRQHKCGPWEPQDARGALRQLRLLRHRRDGQGKQDMRYSLDDGTFRDLFNQAIDKMEAGMRAAGFDPHTHTGQRIGEASNPGPPTTLERGAQVCCRARPGASASVMDNDGCASSAAGTSTAIRGP